MLNEGSKFQKNFYFIETDFISYFPAGTVKNLSTLFTETSLRDFFIQLRSTFDTIIINMPSELAIGLKYQRLLPTQVFGREPHLFA